MASVLAELSQWAAQSLEYWEQAALDKIVSGARFTDADYDELLQHLLEDAGLATPGGNLQHRKMLGGHLEEIEAYVQKRAWAQRASKAGERHEGSNQLA
jgi:hypothetical protein